MFSRRRIDFLIYGYPGGAIMPIYDALWHYMDKINHVLTRHEQGATHAAQGWARVNGKAAVCFATSRPGANQFNNRIAGDAIMDSIANDLYYRSSRC